MPSLDNVDFRPKRRLVKRSPVAVCIRLNAYLLAVFAKGTRVYTIDFDALSRSFKCTRRTVEMAVAKVRSGDRFIFRTVRVGRSYAVQVSDRNPCIKGVFLLTKKKEIPNTTPQPARALEKSSGWVSKPAPRRIQALAAWLARHELAKIHRAGARTMFRIGHALNFAVDALHAGHARADITDAYRYALRSVDADLAHLPPAVRWEPSSLIKLARRRLADGLTAAARVSIRRAALRPVSPANVSAAASFLARVDSLLGADESPAPFSFPVTV